MPLAFPKKLALETGSRTWSVSNDPSTQKGIMGSKGRWAEPKERAPQTDENDNKLDEYRRTKQAEMAWLEKEKERLADERAKLEEASHQHVLEEEMQAKLKEELLASGKQQMMKEAEERLRLLQDEVELLESRHKTETESFAEKTRQASEAEARANRMREDAEARVASLMKAREEEDAMRQAQRAAERERIEMERAEMERKTQEEAAMREMYSRDQQRNSYDNGWSQVEHTPGPARTPTVGGRSYADRWGVNPSGSRTPHNAPQAGTPGGERLNRFHSSSSSLGSWGQGQGQGQGRHSGGGGQDPLDPTSAHQRRPSPKYSAHRMDDFVVVTTDTVPGFSITRLLGEVTGSCLRDIPAHDLNARQIEIQRLSAHEDRRHAVSNMIEQALHRGANAVVGLRFESSAPVTPTKAEVVAYGTAVIVQAVNGGQDPVPHTQQHPSTPSNAQLLGNLQAKHQAQQQQNKGIDLSSRRSTGDLPHRSNSISFGSSGSRPLAAGGWGVDPGSSGPPAATMPKSAAAGLPKPPRGPPVGKPGGPSPFSNFDLSALGNHLYDEGGHDDPLASLRGAAGSAMSQPQLQQTSARLAALQKLHADREAAAAARNGPVHREQWDPNSRYDDPGPDHGWGDAGDGWDDGLGDDPQQDGGWGAEADGGWGQPAKIDNSWGWEDQAGGGGGRGASGGWAVNEYDNPATRPLHEQDQKPRQSPREIREIRGGRGRGSDAMRVPGGLGMDMF